MVSKKPHRSSIDRRSVLKTLAVGSVGLPAIGSVSTTAKEHPNPCTEGDTSGKKWNSHNEWSGSAPGGGNSWDSWEMLNVMYRGPECSERREDEISHYFTVSSASGSIIHDNYYGKEPYVTGHGLEFETPQSDQYVAGAWTDPGSDKFREGAIYKEANLDGFTHSEEFELLKNLTKFGLGIFVPEFGLASGLASIVGGILKEQEPSDLNEDLLTDQKQFEWNDSLKKSAGCFVRDVELRVPRYADVASMDIRSFHENAGSQGKMEVESTIEVPNNENGPDMSGVQ